VTATGTPRVATRRGGSGWLVALVAVVVTAVIQALLARVPTDPGWSAAFVGLALVSFADAALGLGLVASGIATTVRRNPASTVRGLAWTVVLLLVVVAAGVVVPLAVPVVVVPVAWLLAAMALGEPHPLRAAVRALRAAPFRHVLVALATVGLAGLAWLVALVLGVLLPGLIGDPGTWLWFGLTAMAVLRMWCGLHRGVESEPGG
jgi:hypothetical protein